MHARSPCVFDCSSRSFSTASIAAFRIDSAPASATAWYLCEAGLLSEYSRVLTSRIVRAQGNVRGKARRRGAAHGLHELHGDDIQAERGVVVALLGSTDGLQQKRATERAPRAECRLHTSKHDGWRRTCALRRTKVRRFIRGRSEVRYEVVYRVLLGLNTSLRFELMRVGQTAHSEERIER